MNTSNSSISNTFVRSLARALARNRSATINAGADAHSCIPDAIRPVIEMLEHRQLLTSVIDAGFHYLTAPQHVYYQFDDPVEDYFSVDDITVDRLNTNASLLRSTLGLAYDEGSEQHHLTFPGQSNSGTSGVIPDGNYQAFINTLNLPEGAPIGELADHTFNFFFLIADSNHDRAVGLDDFSAFTLGTSGTYATGDFNYDGVVNLDDWTILQANFGRQLPAPLSQPNTASAAALNDHEIEVAWTAPATGTPDGYRVYRSLDGIDFEMVAQVNSGTFSFTDDGSDLPGNQLSDGTKYWYRVRPYTNADGNGETTNKHSAATVLPAPTSLTPSANDDGSVSLSWSNAATTATQFEIERRPSASSSWVEIGVTGNGDTSFVDDSVSESESYDYRVRAVSPDTYSLWSVAATASSVALSAPSDVVAYGDITNVQLEWIDRSATETGYRIQRATNSSFTQNVATLPDEAADSTFALDSGLTEGTDYYYRIAAMVGSSLSTYSTTAVVNTGLAPPSDLITVANEDSVTLTWEDVSTSNSGYLVERSTSADFTENLTQIADLGATATTFEDSTANQGFTYFYRARSYTSTTTSGFAEADVNATTGASRTATINVVGNTAGAGSQAGSVKIYTGQSIHVSLRADGSPLDNNFLKATALQDEAIRANVIWNFGDTTNGSRYNKLPGYNASHIYATPGTYTITVTITVPNNNGATFLSGSDASPSVPSFVTVTGTKVVDVVSPTSTKTIFVDDKTSSGDDGTTAAKAVGWNDAITQYNAVSASSGKHLKVVFVSDKVIAQTTNTNGTPKSFNVCGKSFVTLESSGSTPAVITLATDATGGSSASAFTFDANSKHITIRNLKFQGKTGAGINGIAIAPSGQNIVVDNIRYKNLRNVVNGGEASNLTGLMVLDCNKNATYYANGDFQSGEYFLYAGPRSKNVVVLGNTAADDLRVNANHIVRMYADEVLLYRNTFRNRAKSSTDANVNTMRANNGYYVWWSENTTYAGQLGIFKSKGDLAASPSNPNGSFKNYEVKYAVIERNRILRDRHLNEPVAPSGVTPVDTGQQRFVLGRDFGGEPGNTSTTQSVRPVDNRVGFLSVRNNYIESSGVGTNSVLDTRTHHGIFDHNTFKILTATGAGLSWRGVPGLTANHANVLRGNMFATSGTTGQNHVVLDFSDRRVTGDTTTRGVDNLFASTGLAGVGDNVWPNSGTVTFKFVGTTTGTYSNWRGKFAQEPASRYDVSLVDDNDHLPALGEFRPNNSTTDLARHSEYYGFADDLFGDPTNPSALRNRPASLSTNWTAGAVES